MMNDAKQADEQTAKARSLLFLIHARHKGRYGKLISFLEHQGWSTILVDNLRSLTEDVARLKLNLKQLTKEVHDDDDDDDDDQSSGITHTCLALFRPLVSRKLRQVDINGVLKFCHEQGASLIVSGSQNEDGQIRDNLNALISQLGVRFRWDSVISVERGQTSQFALMHPKEARLSLGQTIANRGLMEAMEKHAKHHLEASKQEAVILYPFGCSLDLVDPKSVCVMMVSSREQTLPKEQCICAFYQQTKSDKARSIRRAIILGSSLMFVDEYFSLGENFCLLESMLDFIGPNEQAFSINMSDAKTLEIGKPVFGPNIETIMELPMLPMLDVATTAAAAARRQLITDHSLNGSIIRQDGTDKQRDDLRPGDGCELKFEERLFNLDNSMLPKIMRAYRDLKVDPGPLSLIKPQFEVRKLPLEPALHGFIVRELDFSSIIIKNQD